MKFRGEDIKRLIPQRYPMMMVDGFEATGEQSAVTALTVTPDNYFLLPDGTVSETALIEHLAQSASALSGWQSMIRGDSEPPVGLIGEVKHFTCHRRACVGETLTTHVDFGLSFGQVTLATGETRIGDELIAQVNMKIFIQ